MPCNRTSVPLTVLSESGYIIQMVGKITLIHTYLDHPVFESSFIMLLHANF